MIKISPSILSADFANLAQEVKLIEEAGANYVHLDIMDGHFVPNLTFGPKLIQKLRPHSNLIFDAHLMIENPIKFIPEFSKAGADIITFHVEVLNRQGILKAINLIHSLGKKAGIAIKPSTDSKLIDDEILQKIDLLLVMTVEPGFSGQKFMHDQLPKIEFFRSKLPKNVDLQVDGGINDETCALVKKSGANCLVSGSFIFSGNYDKKINLLKNS